MFFRKAGRQAAFLYHFLSPFQKRPLLSFYTLIPLFILVMFSLVGRLAADDEPLPDVDVPPTELEVGLDNDAENGETAPTSPRWQTVQQAKATHYAYLPMVVSPPTCSLNNEEQQIADFAIAHPEQGRAIMNCSSILSQVARAKAQDMAIRQFFSHVNPDGIGPNYLVKEAGYNLPAWYGSAMDSNNIDVLPYPALASSRR